MQQVAVAVEAASTQLLHKTEAVADTTFLTQVIPPHLAALHLEALVGAEIPRDLQHFLPWLQTALLVVVALVVQQAQPGELVVLVALMVAVAVEAELDQLLAEMAAQALRVL
jgi:hypothetical protein